MRNESGKSIVILVILTILIMIGVAVVINYAKQMLDETKEQDLKTNMLLMQAEAKKGLEEVCFRTVNLDSTKEEELTKINEIKTEFLEGTILSDSPTEVQEATKNVPDVIFDENCYYLDENVLNEMGIKQINQDGYFIVKYDFSNANLEIINTSGYDGKYTLTQIIQDFEEIEENIEIEVTEENQENQESQDAQS